jgi:hypothetical protein
MLHARRLLNEAPLPHDEIHVAVVRGLWENAVALRAVHAQLPDAERGLMVNAGSRLICALAAVERESREAARDAKR